MHALERDWAVERRVDGGVVVWLRKGEMSMVGKVEGEGEGMLR